MKHIKFYFTFIKLIEEWRARKKRCLTKSFLTILEGNDHTRVYIRKLKENNCYIAQGYYFDKPLERSEFEKRLISSSKRKDSYEQS